ncbi:MAG: hypothetical protein ACR2JB_29945 [Bryobacteraceae bacterium]
MNRKHVLITVVATALIAALAYFYGGSQAPPGQAPLQSLTPQNFAEMKTAFNAAKKDVRVLVLLSPT